jgi:hypothetical protein
VKGIPPWVTYSVLRLLAIVVPLVILLVFVPFEYWPVSVIAAVLIGLCLSYIFLGKQRADVSRELYERRHRKRAATADDYAEDAEIDAAEGSSEPEGRAQADAVQKSDDSGQL